MTKDAFNQQARPALNQYALTLKLAKRETAAAFRQRLMTWLDKKGEYQSCNVLTTGDLTPSSSGAARVSITCSTDALDRVKKAFPEIVFSKVLQENVSSIRVVPHPRPRRR